MPGRSPRTRHPRSTSAASPGSRRPPAPTSTPPVAVTLSALRNRRRDAPGARPGAIRDGHRRDHCRPKTCPRRRSPCRVTRATSGRRTIRSPRHLVALDLAAPAAPRRYLRPRPRRSRDLLFVRAEQPRLPRPPDGTPFVIVPFGALRGIERPRTPPTTLLYVRGRAGRRAARRRRARANPARRRGGSTRPSSRAAPSTTARATCRWWPP